MKKLILLFLFVPIVWAIDISDCTNITSPGHYNVINNINNSVYNHWPCINVSSSNVIINGNGFEITQNMTNGTEDFDSTIFYVSDVTNFTLYDAQLNTIYGYYFLGIIWLTNGNLILLDNVSDLSLFNLSSIDSSSRSEYRNISNSYFNSSTIIWDHTIYGGNNLTVYNVSFDVTYRHINNSKFDQLHHSTSLVDVDNCIVSNFTNSISLSSSENCLLSDANSSGITVTDANNITIRNVTSLNDATGLSLSIFRTNFSTFSDYTIFNCLTSDIESSNCLRIRDSIDLVFNNFNISFVYNDHPVYIENSYNIYFYDLHLRMIEDPFFDVIDSSDLFLYNSIYVTESNFSLSNVNTFLFYSNFSGNTTKPGIVYGYTSTAGLFTTFSSGSFNTPLLHYYINDSTFINRSAFSFRFYNFSTFTNWHCMDWYNHSDYYIFDYSGGYPSACIQNISLLSSFENDISFHNYSEKFFNYTVSDISFDVLCNLSVDLLPFSLDFIDSNFSFSSNMNSDVGDHEVFLHCRSIFNSYNLSYNFSVSSLYFYRDSCFSINLSNTIYYLSANLTGDSCIDFTSSTNFSTLDCNGSSITSTSTYSIDGRGNNYLKNCLINGGYGINSIGSSLVIENVTFDSNIHDVSISSGSSNLTLIDVLSNNSEYVLYDNDLGGSNRVTYIRFNHSDDPGVDDMRLPGLNFLSFFDSSGDSIFANEGSALLSDRSTINFYLFDTSLGFNLLPLVTNATIFSINSTIPSTPATFRHFWYIQNWVEGYAHSTEGIPLSDISIDSKDIYSLHSNNDIYSTITDSTGFYQLILSDYICEFCYYSDLQDPFHLNNYSIFAFHPFYGSAPNISLNMSTSHFHNFTLSPKKKIWKIKPTKFDSGTNWNWTLKMLSNGADSYCTGPAGLGCETFGEIDCRFWESEGCEWVSYSWNWTLRPLVNI